MAGAMDSFPTYHRKQYIYMGDQEGSLIEKAIRHGQQRQQEKSSSQQALFTAELVPSRAERPSLAKVACAPYTDQERLKLEKEVVGFYISGHPLDQYRVELENFCTCHTKNVLTFQGKKVQLAGLVTSAKHRTSRHGKPFGSFVLEDYAGTLPITLFGEDYLKNKHFLEEGIFLHIIGHVVPRYHQADIFELRPKQLRLLSEVRDAMGKSLHVHLPISYVEPHLIAQLEQIATQHPGACTLVLQLVAPEESMQVVCLSRDYSIYPSDEFFEALRALQGIRYRLRA